MGSHRVVVVTRTKNRPILLQRCIRSVLEQSYTDWLHVIVNDGGDPISVQGLVSLSSSEYRGRVRLIHRPQSLGMQNASNAAITATESEFIVIHDDDDSWAPTFLEACTGHLDSVGQDSPEKGVVCQTNWIMEEIDSFGKIIELSKQDFYPFQLVSLSLMARRNQFPPIAFLYRRSVHDKIGYFNQTFNELGDWDFNLRFLLHYDIAVLPNKLANYHWRRQARGSGYGNTVTDNVDSHQKMAMRLQDHYLREDLAAGHTGLGFLLFTAREYEDQRGAHYFQWQTGEHLKSVCGSLMAKAEHFERISADLTRVWKLKVLLNVRGKVNGLKSLVARIRRGRGAPELLAGSDSASTFSHAFQRAQIITLDVFDTVLHRLVRKPTDVFLFMEDDVRSLLGHPELRFPDIRMSAEAAARTARTKSGFTDETTLEQIYFLLARMVGCDEVRALQLMELELAAESALCHANPEILTLIRDASRDGKRVLFVSDMYLPAEHVLGLLQQNGVSGYQLHLSCVVGTTKHRGTLFDHLLTQVEHPPKDILHIGDNLHSDYIQPKKRGIQAHHWVKTPEQTPLADQLASLSGAWDRDLGSSLFVGLVRRQRLNTPLRFNPSNVWEMIGYEVIGPLYLAYASWVLDRARTRGFRKIYFLSRDGFYPLKVFNMVRERLGASIEAEYLFASRRLWNVAGIAAIEKDALDFLMVPNPYMRVRHFLERIGLDAERYREELRRCGFEDIDLVVATKDGVFSTEAHRSNVRELMFRLADPILDTAKRERGILVDYFGDKGLFETKGAIADIGWQASGIRSVNSLLANAGSKNRFAGFYFGTWKYAQASIDAGDSVESFYVDLGQPHFRAELIRESVELLESFFWAPCPTVVGLRKDGDGWQPVFGEAEVEPSFLPGLTLATDAAFAFIEHYLAVVGRRKLPPPFAYLDAVLERLWRCPSKDEAELLGGIGLRDSFGGCGPIRYLAKVPERAAHKTLQEAYDRCHWKKGFLAQLTPRDIATLRI